LNSPFYLIHKPNSEHSSRNNYSPAYRRSPSYGRDSPNNYYHEGRYRASPSDRDRRYYDCRMNYNDRSRRDSYGRHSNGRRSRGNYSSRQRDVESRRSMTRRRYEGRRRDSISNPRNERSSERHRRRSRSRSRRSLSRNVSSNSGHKKSYSRSEHLPNESREASRNHTYTKSPQQSNSSFSCDE
jgi:hypothetical protein